MKGAYRAAVFACCSIAATALVVYSNTLHSPFVFDDIVYITGNELLRDLSNFTDLAGARYIAMLSFALNYAVSGTDPFGYHLVNISIHAVNGMLLWWLVVSIFRTPVMKGYPCVGGVGGLGTGRVAFLFALSAALIFTAHPVQTQSVTYITQRFASLATLFYLLSAALYLAARLRSIGEDGGEGVRRRLSSGLLLAASLISCLVAMKTKEISFTLPFVVALMDWAFFPAIAFRERFMRLVPFMAALLLIPVSLLVPVPVLSEGGGADPFGWAKTRDLSVVSPYLYFISELRVIVTYLRLLFVPVGQVLDYDMRPYESFFDIDVFASAIFLALLITASVALFIRSRRRRQPAPLLASFGVLWFFITLSVESSFVPINDLIFEHRLYLPMAGAAVAFVAAAVHVIGKVEKGRAGSGKGAGVFYRRATVVFLLITVLPLGIAAYERNKVWADDLTLWTDVVAKRPENPRGLFNLGLALFKRDRNDEARPYFEGHARVMAEVGVGAPKSHYYVALVHERMGRFGEAAAALRVSIEQDPDVAAPHSALGVYYMKAGRAGLAAEELRKAIAIDPSAAAHNSLGAALQMAGFFEEAALHVAEALRLDPALAEAHYNMANIHLGAGRTGEAVGEYKRAVELKPSLVEARYNLALIYMETGREAEARRELRAALEINPGYAPARRVLGRLVERR